MTSNRPWRRCRQLIDRGELEFGTLRYVSWIISLLFALVLILFAVSNREPVAFAFWPLFEYGIELPVFLAVLVPVAVAFLFGWLAGWWRAGSYRGLARQRAARIDKLAAEVRRLRAQQNEVDQTRKRAAEGARLTASSEAARGAAEQELPTRPATTALAPVAGPAAPSIESRPH